MLAARLYTMRKLPSLLARTLASGTNGSPLLPDMAEGKVIACTLKDLAIAKQIEGCSGSIYQLELGFQLSSILLLYSRESVSFLARDHVQAMQERKALHTLLAKRQEDLPPRRMKDSYLEVLLPLGSQPEIREKYLNVHNSVRFGRILEDLDSLGVLICYTHTKQEMQTRSPLSIVTALVDKINLCKKVIYPDCDIKFTGNVSWVGKTSMEVKMHMLQLHNGEYSPVLDATFVMVARDPENKRPAFVNPLVPESPEEEEILRQGELNKLKRVDFSTASLLKMAPTAEERNVIHDIFLNTLDTRCSRPFIVSVDDIMFQRPVEVGSLLLFSGQVCYTEKNYIQVRVHSEVYDADTREHHTTNIFHFTFVSENEVPRVVPKTYGGKVHVVLRWEATLCCNHERNLRGTKCCISCVAA
ncbi:UNVERIFIED_CONTAM: hypothetical protein H355_008491 [Colinus virginianus]|nr:hypothetical protein H355_008491 [Colinus virginianus]